jgi:hypothetical protein
MERFRRMETLQKLSSVHASVHNLFHQERHLISRDLYRERRSAALAEWRALRLEVRPPLASPRQVETSSRSADSTRFSGRLPAPPQRPNGGRELEFLRSYVDCRAAAVKCPLCA